MEVVVPTLVEHCKSSIDHGDYKSALFFAEKAVSFLKRSKEKDIHKEVLLLAKCYKLTEQYGRATSLLEREGLVKKGTEAVLLSCLCLFLSGNYEKCLLLIGEYDEVDEGEWEKESERKSVLLSSRTACLRAKVFEALENRNQATFWYLESLRRDVLNYEAFTALKEYHLLNAEQEDELMHNIHNNVYFQKTCGLTEQQNKKLLWELLECKLNPYSMKDMKGMKEEEDTDLLGAKCEKLYYCCRFKECFEMCGKILNAEGKSATGLSQGLLLIYLSCLVENANKNELFYVAHQLVELKPNQAVSWYAVGCYYVLICKYDYARHYFRRCTSTDPLFAEGWIGYAHAFALQGEHDQAMAAYRTSARMISNCHLPSLCIGMEYLRVNNMSLASRFIDSAKTTYPNDPLIYNELGITFYKNGDFKLALTSFHKVFELVGENEMKTSAEWEIVIFNVAHCYRKLKEFNEAIRYFFISLSLKPNNAACYSAIALSYHLSGNLDKAIEFYHQSLGIKADDAFANDMLKRALEEFQF